MRTPLSPKLYTLASLVVDGTKPVPPMSRFHPWNIKDELVTVDGLKLVA